MKRRLQIIWRRLTTRRLPRTLLPTPHGHEYENDGWGTCRLCGRHRIEHDE